MEKINIKVNKKTGMVYLDTTVLGRDLENLQQELVFTFEDSFPLGSARLEYKLNGEKYHIPMMIVGESYTIPIKNVILSEGKIDMQLVVVQAEQDEEIPVFKSNVFYMYCNKSINAQEEAPDDYEYWLDVIEEKLAEVDEALDEIDNIDIDASKSGDTATISITNKEGTTKTVQVKDGIDGQQGETGPANTLSIGTVTKGENASATITGESPNQTLNLVLPKGDKGEKGDKGNTGNDGYSPSASVTQLSGGATITITDKTGTTTATITSGEQGPAGKDGKDGADAKINGVNALNIAAGTNISLEQQGSTLTINATGGSGGTSDYSDLTNKPKINNVELNGNKTSSDLGLITNAVDDLVNYYKKSETFTKQEVNNLISAITTLNIQVVQTLPVQDISTTTIYLVPKTTAETNDAYDEYIYVSNAWEHIGSTEVDLTNYVTNTDYASSSRAGLVKTASSAGTDIVTSNGTLYARKLDYTAYSSISDNAFISKGTLENVITGKGLVTNTDYGSFATAGVVKASSTYGTQFASTGAIYAQTKTYEQYTSSTSPGLFIGKGTLENVITGKGLVSNTDYATSSTGGVIKVSNGDYGMTVDSGVLKGTVRTLAQYNDMSSKGIVCKGTLENVLTDRIGDVETILTRLTTGSGV